MRLSARIKCFRYLVYAYIVLISICGGAQLVIGAFLLWTHRQYSKLVNDQFWEPFGVMIALGIVSQLLCYLGWTSTSKKHRCYLGTFCVFLVAQIIVQFLVGGWAMASRHQLQIPAELALESNFQQFLGLTGATADPTHVWNRLQRDFHCCGLHSVHDFQKVTKPTSGIPWSCYEPINKEIYAHGCMHVFMQSIQTNMMRVAALAIATALVQSLGIFCVIQLVMLLKKTKMTLPNGANGANQSMRMKRPLRETMPLAAPTPSTISHPTPLTPSMMGPHSSGVAGPSISTKPPIAQKPVVPRIEPPIIK
ncbi:CD63 antigen [Uranotaenia lowii]|uniref:CD63 antigen n=1 Tax=Uranotaenia lowii TaxID=190385 RepID=UPI00247928C1|nr:CD63 antigen [Uranotaenia lowii]